MIFFLLKIARVTFNMKRVMLRTNKKTPSMAL